MRVRFRALHSCASAVWVASALVVLASAERRAALAQIAAPQSSAASQAAKAAAPQVTQATAPQSSQPQAVAAADPDTAAVMALVERYFAVLNQHDSDGALPMWSASADSHSFVQATLLRMLQTSDPTWSNVRVSQVVVDGPKARARVEFDLSYQPYQAARPGASGAPGQPSAPRPRVQSHARDVMTFVRDGREWRIESEVSEAQDIARRLVAAPDEAALQALIAEEGPRINFGVLQALYGIGGEAKVRNDFAASIHATSLGLRLAEAMAAEAKAAEARPVEAKPAEAEAARSAGSSNPASDALAESYVLHGLTDLASVYAYKPAPDLPKAIELLTRALAIQVRSEDELGQGNTLQARGNAYYTSGDYSRALDDYQHALTLQTRQTDADGAARSRLGVGNVQFLFGQFDLALDAYQQALQTFEQMQNVEPQPRALFGLARVYDALGDYTRSRDLFTRALALFTASSRRSEQASALREIGHSYFVQGKLDDAASQFNEALAIDTQLKDAVGQGRALFALGLLQVVRGHFDDAIQTCTRSAEAFTRAGYRDGLAQAILARAAAKLEQRDLAGALTDYTESARTFDAAKNREGVARANVGLAMTHVVRREIEAALDAADVAWQTAEQAGAPEIAWQARYESGRASALAGESDRARQMFEEAIATLERSQFEAGGDADTAPPARRAAPYVALVEWHVAHGDATQALLLAEAAKRRLLQDLLLPYRFRIAGGLTPEQRQEERRLFSERVSIAKQLRRERQRPAPDSARIVQLETGLAAARAAADEWHRTMVPEQFQTAFLRGDVGFTSVLEFGHLASLMTDASALVQFVVGETQTTVIVATRKATSGSREIQHDTPAGVQGATQPTVPTLALDPRWNTFVASVLDVRAYSIDVTRAQLAQEVAHFSDAIVRRLDSTAADGRALYDRLFGPARDQLTGHTQLVVVPDDWLWTLPFQALRTPDDRYLDQDFTIALLPSAATWVLRAPPARATPAGTATQPTSSAAGGEATALVAAGTISDLVPFQSTLTLVQPRSTPETVAAWELFDHPLHADSLLLLDRASTDEQIRLDQGRLGVVGLAWAMQAAGVPRVTIARWPLTKEERDRALRGLTTVIAPPAEAAEPREWAAWMPIGPP